MMQQSTEPSFRMRLYLDVEAAILDRESAHPDWHFGFNAGLTQRGMAGTVGHPTVGHPTVGHPTMGKGTFVEGTLAEAQNFAGLMLRRWLRAQEATRAQFWRDIANAAARCQAN